MWKEERKIWIDRKPLPQTWSANTVYFDVFFLNPTRSIFIHDLVKRHTNAFQQPFLIWWPCRPDLSMTSKFYPPFGDLNNRPFAKISPYKGLCESEHVQGSIYPARYQSGPEISPDWHHCFYRTGIQIPYLLLQSNYPYSPFLMRRRYSGISFNHSVGESSSHEFWKNGSVEILPLFILLKKVMRRTPSLPQGGRQPRGIIPQTPFCTSLPS